MKADSSATQTSQGPILNAWAQFSKKTQQS